MKVKNGFSLGFSLTGRTLSDCKELLNKRFNTKYFTLSELEQEQSEDKKKKNFDRILMSLRMGLL